MSRINLILFLICLVGLALSTGCENTAQMTGKFTDEEMAKIPLVRRADPPAFSDGLALSVKSETITIDQVVTPVMRMLDVPAGSSWDSFRVWARPVVKDTVIRGIRDILLYQEAKKGAPENIDELLDSAVENEVKKLIASYGDNYALAQEAIAEQGMDWQQYRQFQKKFLLTKQYYISQSLLEDKPISHSQMLEYYEEIQQDGFQFTGLLRAEDVTWEGFIEFRLIDIELDKVEVDDGETRKDAALRKAAELIERIKQGEDFGDLAKVHSDDPYRAPNGGKWSPVTGGSPLVGRWEILGQKAEEMEVGAVSEPIESDGYVYIMKLEQMKKSGVASFEDLQPRIELDIQLARRAVRFDKLITKLMSRANISGLDRFIDVCVEKAWSRWQVAASLSSK